MPEVNLLSAAAVLFKGGTYTELSDWCKTMGVQMIAQTTLYAIQNAYLYPAIEILYMKRRNEVLARVFIEQEDGKWPHLAGDGRCYSPGFNAKYCHYTFMLDDTKEIIHTELVQATSSGAMEPLGFRRGMTELLDMGLDVEVMTTDRSSSIRKIMSEQNLEIQHEFDIWHRAKATGFRNKLLAKGEKKDKEILLAWTRSVVNHMWYTCAISKGNIKALQNRWKSITHHVCNEHEWRDDDGTRHQCDHPPLTAHDQKVWRWFDEDSVAFQALSSVVLNERLLKDLNQMVLFKHTGPLENFHSALLKYLPKRQAFSYEGMRERCHLDILDHNENIVKRKQATTVTGELRFNQVYCKKSKQWILKSLIERVLENRRNPNITFKMATSSLVLPQPALPPNIAPIPKPSKETAKASFQSRF